MSANKNRRRRNPNSKNCSLLYSLLFGYVSWTQVGSCLNCSNNSFCLGKMEYVPLEMFSIAFFFFFFSLSCLFLLTHLVQREKYFMQTPLVMLFVLDYCIWDVMGSSYWRKHKQFTIKLFQHLIEWKMMGGKKPLYLLSLVESIVIVVIFDHWCLNRTKKFTNNIN